MYEFKERDSNLLDRDWSGGSAELDLKDSRIASKSAWINHPGIKYKASFIFDYSDGFASDTE